MPRPLPASVSSNRHRLCGRAEIAAMVGIAPEAVTEYAARWFADVAVVVRVKRGTRGRLKVPLGALEDHADRLREGEPVENAERTGQHPEIAPLVKA